jgi:hypothetical protein
MKRLRILTVALLALAAVVAYRAAPSRPVPASPTPLEAAPPPQGTPTRPSDEAKRAASTLEAARKKLIAYHAVELRIVQRAEMGGRRFNLTGKYLQGRDLRLRLEFTTILGKTKASLLQVCDGKLLWQRRSIGERESILRRDVRRILEAAAEREAVASRELIAELGIGGIPGLLASLERNFEFRSYEKKQIDGKSFLVVEGRWREGFMKESFPQQSEGDVPAFVPEAVRIYFDSNNLFPRRIRYLKTGSRTLNPILTIDFVNIRLNGAVSDDEFEFAPPEKARAIDDTAAYIRRMFGEKK